MSKIIAISGVSRGLGFHLAEKFLKEGCKVVGFSRSGKGPSGMQICSVVDVSDAKAVASFAKKVITEVGEPDFLINSAALMNHHKNTWEINPAEIKELINTNVVGVFNMISAFVPAMVKTQTGVVVNFSSGWGRSTSPHVAPYCASKYAIEGLTSAMSKEIPSGMAVVTLNPGFIDTDMVRGALGVDTGAEDPEKWSVRAVRFILKISPVDNGCQLTVL